MRVNKVGIPPTYPTEQGGRTKKGEMGVYLEARRKRSVTQIGTFPSI